MGEQENGTREKRPFDIEIAVSRIRDAISAFPQAALFELADAGFSSLFEQLVACIVSIRTFDEVTVPAAHRLFELARTPRAMERLTPVKIDDAIHACTFHEAKAYQIHKIAQFIVTEHGEVLPCDAQTLLSFQGVGPKCANLALGIACGQARIGVDIHVHRVTNRWGYVQTRTPEQTLAALETRLPVAHWVEINRLLVPFGKHICNGNLPHCSTCPVLDMCQQVNVKAHR